MNHNDLSVIKKGGDRLMARYSGPDPQKYIRIREAAIELIVSREVIRFGISPSSFLAGAADGRRLPLSTTLRVSPFRNVRRRAHLRKAAVSENRHSRFDPSDRHRQWAVDASLLTRSSYCIIAVENYSASSAAIWRPQ